jgi:DNA-binding MarR family transcriptional regulator
MTAEVRKTDTMTVTEVAKTGSPEVVAPPATEEISRSILQLTEDVLELLRARSRSAVYAQKRPELLWLDDLTVTQMNTVVVISHLCDEFPEGVTLKTLAETVGVTPAAASVMVDLLVKKKMLTRTRSKNDRRAVLIRLSPATAGLFEITEVSHRQSIASLEESLGRDAIRDWQRIMVAAIAVLRQPTGGETPPEAEPGEERLP